jgi:hypothetical protein
MTKLITTAAAVILLRLSRTMVCQKDRPFGTLIATKSPGST